ncbi:MAG: hypothetical protein RL135_1326 [Bacteroidota bacterium]
MKPSNYILLALIAIVSLSLIASNYLMKAEYNKLDKNDPYYNYKTVLNQPFHHLQINGGNFAYTNFEPSEKYGVRHVKYHQLELEKVIYKIINDTLFMSFPDSVFKKENNRFYASFDYPVIIISAPDLKSINGINCLLGFNKMNQTEYQIQLNGNSNATIKTQKALINTMEISLADSSNLNIQNSDSLKERISIDHVLAHIKNASVANFGNSKINHLNAQLDSLAAIQLSGFNLNRLKNMP